jgi:23S rRNA (adenine-N6)-dimethyltransferase
VAARRGPARAPGRHFFRSKQLAAWLVDQAELKQGDLVVEIGGGTGLITRALARTGASVLAVELDRLLAAQLRARFVGSARVKIVEADATQYRWPDEPFTVVANLPFARSGAILARLLRNPALPLRQALVIVQWEFATKHAALWPATLRSTYWRAWYDIAIARRLDRTAFSPPPSVDGAVLRFERRARPLVPPALHDSYWRFVAAAYGSRAPLRRSLRPSLSALEIKRLAPALGFSVDAHARDLEAEQWAELFRLSRFS